MNITEIRHLREAEDRVEFKEAVNGNFNMDGGAHADPKKRRRCVVGYCVALANEGGGHLIFGVKEGQPNQIVGTSFLEGRLGEAEATVYQRLQIRITATELHDDKQRRVLVMKVPSRPPGKALKFEEVPLMRVGDELRPMSDDRYFQILNEREPDFSATICPGLAFDELSSEALNILKREYASNQKNERFLTQTDEQILIDLNLLTPSGGLTYAALILLGTEEALRSYLPQANIRLEWRTAPGSIRFDRRFIYAAGYLLELNNIWSEIDRHNRTVQVQRDSHMFPVYTFNEGVIREALNNAVGHRDYRLKSEVVIKQYPDYLSVVSPGGFPLGVSQYNLLDVPSTPRNALLTEVLAKLGMVERSGQGVDAIYYRCLADAKGEPDYSKSDDYFVHLEIPGLVKDEAFAAWINKVQFSRNSEERLTVREVIALEKVRARVPRKQINGEHLSSLLQEGLITRSGTGRGTKYRLCRDYYIFADRKGQYALTSGLNEQQHLMLIVNHLSDFEEARMSEFFELLGKDLSQYQIRRLIYKLTEVGMLEGSGNTRSRTYKLSPSHVGQQQVIARATALGLEQMIERGELERNYPQIQKYK